MRFFAASTALALAAAAHATSWTFSDASVSVDSKTSEKTVETFSSADRSKKTIDFGHQDVLKITLTTKDGSKARRPHQAFLVIKEASGLEAPYALTLKESGKGVVQISHKDLPAQLLTAAAPLEASLVLGSTGSTEGSVTPVFDIAVKLDPDHPTSRPAAPLRYGKLAEIHHVFRADPKSPPKIVSLVFSLAVLATVPALFLGWIGLGGNLCHVPTAIGNAPLSHALFCGSIVAMEGVFLSYYSTWNLFQTLPVMAVVGVVAFFSGTKALGEVQARRLAGDR
ncbi:oligosaccharyltransferase subunit ribophorin II [Metarhizium album ARSEF 1941]|uniref:Oligosaccharyltransferase subunit ribophorin II n=1 Tax=Metarhizium album (strain ARSEF 1941) TaxID=1081103 RepID=A0A0B2WPI1_METAS|nr:oligosaccharyltransferase subunit ribophorin II [Metarhizium album ARSEF 1941]KHN95554.1 oligosaccharyltransferase subunit ribophorin II [Metarhizium album ARSEF 1941]